MTARALESGRYGEGTNKPDSTKKGNKKMKKLMIAALAVASVAGAYAACSYTEPTTAWVYKWTFTGKTTFGVKPAAVKVETGLCGYTGGGSSDVTCTVRAPASLKIEGYTWYCEPGYFRRADSGVWPSVFLEQ